MNFSTQKHISPTDNPSSPFDELKQRPPAFLDLARSAARLGSNMLDMSAWAELKRLEHERQPLIQRKIFEEQMCALEQQQAQELLSIPVEPNDTGVQHLSVSAPTTPPRFNAVLQGKAIPGTRHSQGMDADLLSKAIGAANKRKSVTYAPSVYISLDLNASANYSCSAGAKSMHTGRETSASNHDNELAGH
jgi:hypothetical protein